MKEKRISKLFYILNQPFILWFLSTVVIGSIVWQYNETQKETEAIKRDKQIVKKYSLEISILTRDILWSIRYKEQLTFPMLQQLLSRMQYNSYGKNSTYYSGSLMNIMLDLDARKDLNGIGFYSQRLYKRLVVLSIMMSRIQGQIQSPNQRIWNLFSKEEQSSFNNLKKLIDEIEIYYRPYSSLH